MGSDASEDGDPTQPDATPGASAAFAATVAPERSSEPPTAPRASPIDATQMQAPTPPPLLPAGTTSGAITRPRSWVELESDVTLDAPTVGDAPALPVVSAAHYRADREIARGGMG